MMNTRGSDAAGAATITINGRELKLSRHETDFSVLAPAARLTNQGISEKVLLGPTLTRARTADASRRDAVMDQVRDRAVAHHIYRVDGTGEELIIDDRIMLSLRRSGAGELEQLLEKYHLQYVRKVGGGHVVRVTSESGGNPIKVANELLAEEVVLEAHPLLHQTLLRHDVPVLFDDQWYLTTDLIQHPDVLTGVDIGAPVAWQTTTGEPEIVLAVIDDGFDLGHPAFAGTRIHAAAWDYQDRDAQPTPDPDDYHGTPVASIAVATHDGNAIRGIAPGCTFLPVRIGFGATATDVDILQVFEYVSQHADVVNCSFGFPPSSFDRLSFEVRRQITELTRTGGRRGKGLVMVFSAANDDSPTFLEGSRNRNGVRFTSGSSISTIPAGASVFSAYPMTEGVVVVGASTSLKRKAGYSNWGPHITVSAPSNNMHYIMAFVPGGTPGRSDFIASYRGLGQVAAVNRPGNGKAFTPLPDDPVTATVLESHYTRSFGGTSGAAPVVSGVAALILSANPALTAEQVRQILMSTADKDLDSTLDLASDPNVQGLSGAFQNGRSLFFGAGKVNAARAVQAARALLGGGGSTFDREVRPAVGIPDNKPAGIVSTIECPISGKLRDIEVTLGITHTYRGDLRVSLISPEGFVARLHDMQGAGSDTLQATYAAVDPGELQQLARSGVKVAGTWTIQVSDNLARDVGTLDRWRLVLRTQ